MNEKRVIPASSFVGTIATNVDNPDLSDKKFRDLIRDALPIVIYERLESAYIKKLHLGIICANEEPMKISSYRVSKHHGMGTFKSLNISLSLTLTKSQLNPRGGFSTGRLYVPIRDILKDITKMNVLNANFLDYFLIHPEKIPEEWKEKRVVIFWGTFYEKGKKKRQYVSYLRWLADKWRRSFLDISDGLYPARLTRQEIKYHAVVMV